MAISKINLYLILGLTIVLQSMSFLSIKLATMNASFTAMALIVVAFGFIGLRTIAWQFLLSRAALSHIYPYASLVQPLVFLYAILIFGEPYSWNNLVGLLFMVCGVMLLSR